MTCPTEEQLISFITETATNEEYSTMYAHIQECETCATWLNEQQDLIGFVQTEKLPEPPKHLHQKIMAGIDRATAPTLFERIHSFFSLKTPGLSLAAAAGLCILLIALFSSDKTPTAIQVAFNTNPGLQELVTGPTQIQAQTGITVEVARGEVKKIDWFHKGTVAVEGPASCTIVEDGITVDSGTLTAWVKPGPEGFFIDSGLQRASVVGTCFAVSIANDKSRVSVFEGIVKVEKLSDKTSQMLTAGQSATTRSATNISSVTTGTKIKQTDNGTNVSGNDNHESDTDLTSATTNENTQSTPAPMTEPANSSMITSEVQNNHAVPDRAVVPSDETSDYEGTTTGPSTVEEGF